MPLKAENIHITFLHITKTAPNKLVIEILLIVSKIILTVPLVTSTYEAGVLLKKIHLFSVGGSKTMQNAK